MHGAARSLLSQPSHMGAIERKRSCPAVSHSWNTTSVLPALSETSVLSSPATNHATAREAQYTRKKKVHRNLSARAR